MANTPIENTLIEIEDSQSDADDELTESESESESGSEGDSSSGRDPQSYLNESYENQEVFDNWSIFRGIKKDDVDTLRNLMVAFAYHEIDDESLEKTIEKFKLNKRDQAIVGVLDRQRCVNGLLKNLIIRFASYRFASPRKVLQAAQNFDNFAIPAVLAPQNRPRREYIVVLNYHKAEMAKGIFPPQDRGFLNDSELGSDPAIDSDTDSKDDKTVSNSPKPEEPEKILVSTEEEAEHSSDPVSSESNYSDGGAKAGGKKKKKKVARSTSKGKSKVQIFEALPKNCRYVRPQPNVDRTPLKLGNADEKKLKTVLATEKKDPNNRGAWIPSKPITFSRPEFDINDRKAVSLFNSRRRQFLDRALGKQTKGPE